MKGAIVFNEWRTKAYSVVIPSKVMEVSVFYGLHDRKYKLPRQSCGVIR